MWAERYAIAARRHPDLVGIYESGAGRLALLLRQTVVPLADERRQWLAETRRVARASIASLRASGLRSEVIVLQWRPLREVAHVLRHWICRYAGDPDRCHQLIRVVERYLADRQFVVACALPPHELPPPSEGVTVTPLLPHPVGPNAPRAERAALGPDVPPPRTTPRGRLTVMRGRSAGQPPG